MAGKSDRGEFATHLRRLREAASLTQEELAARAGLTSNAIGALERGERRRPYPYTVRALADALEVSDADRTALVNAARPADSPADVASVVGSTSGVTLDTLARSRAPITPLLGRDVERLEVLGLLRSGQSRVLTITGPGGVGKTRLATAVADQYAAEQLADVAVVELAHVHDVALVLPTIALALGLRQSVDVGLINRLADHLGDRPHLLVLDNVEHLLSAAPTIAELSAACRSLLVLATSRAPLRIRTERDYPLAPLALPTNSDLASVAASPAVQMFLDRATSVAPSFVLTRGNAKAVAAVCRRLDGLPLAMELAAAHAGLLEPDELLARLDVAVSTARSRDLPARQATMRATLDWSHELLTGDEQAMFRRLSIFTNTFTVDAAEAVAASEIDGFAALGGLVEQSLVVADRGSPARFSMLQPVRQYAAHRLSEGGEEGIVATRHAAYFWQVGNIARHGLHGARQASWLDRLQAEHGDLHAALTTSVEHGDIAMAMRLLADTWLYWALRGTAGEALSWIEQLLANPATCKLPANEQAPAYLALAGLRYATGAIAATFSAATAAVERFGESRSDLQGLAEALVIQGSAALFSGDVSAAVDPLRDAIAISEEVSDRWTYAHAVIATSQLQMLTGDLETSRTTIQDAELVARELGCAFTLATALNMRASLALAAGSFGDALEPLTEAASLATEVGTTWTLVYTLPALAIVAGRQGLPDVATVLLSAGAATAKASSLVVSFPPDRDSAESYLGQLRAQLDDAAFTEAWQHGQDLAPAAMSEYIAQIKRSSAPR